MDSAGYRQPKNWSLTTTRRESNIYFAAQNRFLIFFSQMLGGRKKLNKQ
jgi:hypothetical protein